MMYVNISDSIPVQFYWWTHKCEFYIIFMGHTMRIFFWYFFKPLKNVQTLGFPWQSSGKDSALPM